MLGNRRGFHGARAAVVLALCVATSTARVAAIDGLASGTVKVENFGRINDRYYRGAQPDRQDYAALAALGIRTVIDLTRDGQPVEQRRVEAAGMAFHRIPLTTTERPSESAISAFLALVTDPALQPVFVHCQGGRHRTGVMTAVYRMTQDGWSADQAYAEMQKYRFEGFPDHPALRQRLFRAARVEPDRPSGRHRCSEWPLISDVSTRARILPRQRIETKTEAAAGTRPLVAADVLRPGGVHPGGDRRHHPAVDRRVIAHRPTDPTAPARPECVTLDGCCHPGRHGGVGTADERAVRSAAPAPR